MLTAFDISMALYCRIKTGTFAINWTSYSRHLLDFNEEFCSLLKQGELCPRFNVDDVPDENEVQRILAEASALLKSGEHVAAYAVIRKACRTAVNIHHPDVLLHFGHYFEATNKPFEAHSFYRRAVENSHGRPNIVKELQRFRPQVDELDNAQLRDVLERYNSLCSVWEVAQLKKACVELFIREVHNTCALEGNRSTPEKARELLNLKGNSISEELSDDEKEIMCMAHAYQHLLQKLTESKRISFENILDIHSQLLPVTDAASSQKPGEFRQEDSSGITSEEFESEMGGFLEWINRTYPSEELDLLTLASAVHYYVTLWHPFVDGNGRMARLLMNFVLLRSDFPIVTIPATHQEEYLARLKDADMGDLRPFVRFVLKCAGDSLQFLEQELKDSKAEEPRAALEQVPDLSWIEVLSSVVENPRI